MHPSKIEIIDCDYELPASYIAEKSLPQRDSSKLLQYKNGNISHHTFTDLPNLLPENCLIVFNDSKVIPARLYFTTIANATIEIFCLEPLQTNDYAIAMSQTSSCKWKCLIGNKKKWKEEKLIATLDDNCTVEVQILEAIDDAYKIQFSWNSDKTFAEILLAIGQIPLPPYIKREIEISDSESYQTVYAKHDGSVAAPTAGLHFTNMVFENLHSRNIIQNYITLHVGAGTFKPVKAKHLADHVMHAEWFVVSKEIVENIKTHATIFCVGTTTLRTLESIYWLGVKIILGLENKSFTLSISQWEVYEPHLCKSNYSVAESMQAIINYLDKYNLQQIVCSTQIIITPAYKIRTIQALITNFHQPQSTLLLLISSIVGNHWKTIYSEALQNNYRFLSYGDSSILWL
jgi:S-adenosylmethionine:tRNA ribosyltransferase-isomerase